MYPLDNADEVKDIPGMAEVLKRNQPFPLDKELYDTEEVCFIF